jgi:endoglucanase
MNEPHDVDAWEATSQTAVTAIRASGDDKLILIPGDDWSSANRWPHTHNYPWIDDPADNIAYEAHLYFDRNESGRYRHSYDEELARDHELATVGRRRLARFAGWCRNHGVRGFLGEYGVPAEEPRWHAVLDDMLDALDEWRMDGLYWAAGEWWPPEDRLSIQPEADFTVDRPQLAVLARHPR